jgi:hypothetical protein
MCRNIKTLFNFDPPATEEEVRAAALQFVRKVSGFNRPSQANAAAFDRAIAEVTAAARTLLAELQTNAPARDRDIEAEKARARSRERFAAQRVLPRISEATGGPMPGAGVTDFSALQETEDLEYVERMKCFK